MSQIHVSYGCHAKTPVFLCYVSGIKNIITSIKTTFTNVFDSVKSAASYLLGLDVIGAFADGLAYQPQLQPVPVTNNIVRVTQTPQQTSSTVNNIYVTVDGTSADDVTLADKIAKRIADAMNNM